MFFLGQSLADFTAAWSAIAEKEVLIVFGVGAGSRSKRGKDRKCLVPRVLLEHTESGKCGLLRFHNEKKDNNIKLNKTRTPPFFPKVCVCVFSIYLSCSCFDIKTLYPSRHSPKYPLPWPCPRFKNETSAKSWKPGTYPEVWRGGKRCFKSRAIYLLAKYLSINFIHVLRRPNQWKLHIAFREKDIFMYDKQTFRLWGFFFSVCVYVVFFFFGFCFFGLFFFGGDFTLDLSLKVKVFFKPHMKLDPLSTST